MERTRRGVLVVEDDGDLREAVAAILELNGYDVVAAADGEEALCRLRSPAGLAVGLILLDLRMPRMDGRAFRAAQLGDPRLATIPVVIVSGEADGAGAAAELVPVAYCQKPVDVEGLLVLIAGYCDAARRTPSAV